VQEWIESKPEREKMNLIKDEFDMIMNKMNEYKKKSHPISDAVAFVNSCLPYLGELKKKLGKNDKLYLNISTSVCNIAQETIVSNVNRAMEKWNAYVKWQNNNSLIRL
jgi:hypothetical protein